MYRRQLSIAEQEAADHPALPEYQSTVVGALRRLSFVLQAMERYDEQEPIAARRMKLQRELSEQYPDIPSYRKNLAWTVYDYGFLLHQRGRADDAVEHFEEAISIYDRLIMQHPNNSRFLLHLSGMIYYCPVERLRNLERAVSLLKQHQQSYSTGLGELAMAQASAGRFQEAWETCEKADENNVNSPGLAVARMIVLWHQGQHDEARAMLRRLGEQLYSTPNHHWYQFEVRFLFRRFEELMGITVQSQEKKKSSTNEEPEPAAK